MKVQDDLSSMKWRNATTWSNRERIGTSSRTLLILLLLLLSSILVACADSRSQDKANVDGVELRRESGTPPQYTAVVSGYLPDACTEIDRTEQKVDRSTIEVAIYTTRPEDLMCAAMIMDFEEEVILDVEGLSAGSYDLDVNGVVTTVSLTEDH